MEFTATQTVIIDSILPIAVLIIMFSMGLSLTFDDFKRVLTQPILFVIAMLGQYLMIPIVAILLISLLKIPSEIAVGAMILVAVPGGVLSNALVYVGRGNVALSVSLTGISQIVGLISIPLWVSWALSTYYADFDTVEVFIWQSLIVVFVLNIVPMGVGMLVRHFNESLASKLEPTLRRISMILLFVLVVLTLMPNIEVAIQEAPTAGLLSLLLCSFGIVFGNAVTRAFGYSWEDAFTNGIEISIQNLATGLLIAVTVLGLSELAIYTAVYSVVGTIIALLSILVFSRINKPTATD